MSNRDSPATTWTFDPVARLVSINCQQAGCLMVAASCEIIVGWRCIWEVVVPVPLAFLITSLPKAAMFILPPTTTGAGVVATSRIPPVPVGVLLDFQPFHNCRYRLAAMCQINHLTQ